MDEAVEIITSGTKLQNIQTILSFFISGINNFFFYTIPFLLENPSIFYNNNNKTEEKIIYENICGNNSVEINQNINEKNYIINYSIIYELLCEDNIYNIQILAFLYYVSKGIGSFILGFLTDKFGRKIILFFGSILTIINFICLYLSLYNYYFLFISFILIGICSYLYVFSFILVC